MIHRPTLLSAIAICFAASTASAQPIEYVRVCDAYGTGYMYVPGTEICYNPTTGLTAVNTEGGTFYGVMPNTPTEYVSNAAAACIGGELVDLGTLTSTSFSRNSYQRLGAPLTTPTLAPTEFISHVILTGSLNRAGTSGGMLRFTGTDEVQIPTGTRVVRGDVIYETLGSEIIASGIADVQAYALVKGSAGVMTAGTTLTLQTPVTGVDNTVTAFTDFEEFPYTSPAADLCFGLRDSGPEDMIRQAVLGCVNPTEQPNALSFIPRSSIVPTNFVAPVALTVTSRDAWIGIYDGQLQISACVRDSADTGAACTVTPAAAGTLTLTCGSETYTLPSGNCSLADDGNGRATMSCPDGTTVSVLTSVPDDDDDDGCSAAPGASVFALVAVLGLRMVRRSRRS